MTDPQNPQQPSQGFWSQPRSGPPVYGSAPGQQPAAPGQQPFAQGQQPPVAPQAPQTAGSPPVYGAGAGQPPSAPQGPGQPYPSTPQSFPGQPQGAQPGQAPGSQPGQAPGFQSGVQPYPGSQPGQVPGYQSGPQSYPGTQPGQAPPGYVQAGAVASQVAEFVEIPGRGAVKLASIGQRALGRILDYVLICIVEGIVIAIITAILVSSAASASATAQDGSSDGAAAGLAAGGVGGAFLLGLLFVLVIYAYETVCIGVWGQTLGKKIAGVKVVKAVNGNNPGIGWGLVRYLIPGLCGLVPFVGFILPLVCFLSATFDGQGRRQGWHDKVAGTLVISTKR